MCNAKPEQRFRSYGGIVLNVGSVEMLADSVGDVSKHVPLKLRYLALY